MRAPILLCHRVPSRNSDPGRPIRLSHNYRGGNPTVSRAGSRFGFNLSLRFDFGTTGAIKSEFSKFSSLRSNSKHPNRKLADVCTTLKSVARGLCAVLNHYDVWYTCSLNRLHCSLLKQQTVANRETIESLIPRVEDLAESLSTPALEGEVREIKRRKELNE